MFAALLRIGWVVKRQSGLRALHYNCNKRSIVLDLKSGRGRQILLDLVPRFDVFVENYGPG